VNLSLSDEQVLLREAARGTLARHKTIEAAREALEDPAKLPDLWPTAVEAGWPGLLISEEHGGAELDAFDAMLVAEECGRVLAPVPLLGVLPATAVLDAAGHSSLPAVAAGEQRPVYLAARPPGDLETRWTVEPASGMIRAAAPQIEGQGEGVGVTVTGTVAFVPDAPGADLLVVIGTGADGEPAAAIVQAGAPGVQIDAVMRYDATRPLANVTLSAAAGELLEVDAAVLADAWYLAHSLIAADSLGAVQTCLDRSVQYAKERFTFGRAIGSYQSIKHELVEILRRQENVRGLQYYAGWAAGHRPDPPHEEFALAASAVRSAAGEALDFATRAMINVHGGIGATWEHDAPLFFRRAELSRRLLGGTRDATDRVAERALAQAVPA
jgi:alkylation response protein AidB-like acyl-CoA dehydrogenase